MSTLSGNATKGEKGKKFQQLKILLPSGSKSAEPEQQPNKSSAQRIQHGMTSLGKVPTARRPTNLPSEKSEQSGNDPSINLVPSGGPGWGNKPNETGPTPTPSLAQNVNPPASAPVNNTPMPGTSQPVQHVQHYPPASRMPPMPPQVGHVPVHHGHPDPKTWARMTLGGETQAANSFTPQSPLFHSEFPSLSSNAEATTAPTTHATAIVAQKPTTNTVADTQYGPGPSLRPQTVSWMSGSRPQGTMGPQAGSPIASAPAQVRPAYPAHIGPDGARNNLAPSGVGVVPAGPYHPSVMSDKIPQYGALMPPFMLRNSYPGGFPPPGVGPRPPYGPAYITGQHAPAERFMPPPASGANSAKRPYDDEDTKIRSIIKEEDLNQMANIGTDIGWAGHEDIDYNQKLKFSDDEDDDKGKDGRSGKSRSKMQHAAKLASDKPALRKESDKENEFRTSMENLKEREKMFQAAGNRPLEIGNAWHARKNIVAANATTRYQITTAPGPGPGRIGEDDEELQERRKQKKDEMEIIIQRARERKEEVEKQYRLQMQQAANIKLKQLDERIEQQRKMENKDQHFTEREMDMLPEWEKEKLRAQNRLVEVQNIEDAKKSATATPVPVVKDASEFRALTQLGDRSTFSKKEKEPVNAAPNANYTRSFTSNVPPRFQHLNRQTSANSGTNSAAPPPQGPSDARKNSLSQFSNKSNSPGSGFGPARHSRLDSDSMSDKEDPRKERYISDDRYQRDNVHTRDYNYDRDDDQRKYEKDSKKKFYEKGDYAADTGRDFDRETNYGAKFERKNSESDRSDKSKDYISRRYSETESHDKEPVMSWRHEESPEKARHFNAPPRSPRTFSETEHRERKKSREEGNYEKLSFNVVDKERDYYRKDLPNRDRHADSERDKEHDHHRDSFDYKSIENEVKRDRDLDKKEKDHERKSPATATYDDRLRESRYSRESRETLRDESRYTIQEERAYSWVDEGEVEEKPALRRDHHYREERGDRYSHAQRHPPGPITREKLEAKELEDSKRNLTALIRSDKKTEIKKSEPEEKKGKDEQENATKSDNVLEPLTRSQKREEQIKSVWHKEDKKDKDESKSAASSADATADKKENKEKDDVKENSKSASSKQPTDELASTAKGSSGGIDDKRDRDRRDDRKKSERLPKRDTRGNNWARHPVYRGNPYGGGRVEPKLHRSGRTSGSGGKNSSRRDSKYSESDYSDEISGSGREDRGSRNDRDERALKSKRYERDDRNMDYRNDNRDYQGGNRQGGRNRDYYNNYKPTHRGRGGFRTAASVGKRMDGYGPPPSKSPFGNVASYGEERRHKSKDIDGHGHGHDHGSDKKDSSHADKSHAEGKHSSGGNSRQQNDVDRAAKKNEAAQENKSTVSSPTSVQTAEANEESFATASEGTDSEDNGQITKSKPTYSGTKRQATVVVAKPTRANHRSTSRKRFEGREARRPAPLYSRKESGSYGTAKRNSTSTGGGKSFSGGNKENEKYTAEGTTNSGFGKGESENKSGFNEKSRREYSDSQASSASASAAKKNIKSRNRSNSRRNIGTSGSGPANSTRAKNQEVPARMPAKQRKSYDTKLSSDYKESKLDIPMPLFKELGPPIPAPPPATNAWDKPITGVLRNGSPSTSVSSAQAAANAAAVAAAAAAAAANSVAIQSNAPGTIGGVGVGHDKGPLHVADQHVDSTRSDLTAAGLGVDKVATKGLENLDGSTPPVQTIIFENTNFKSAPGDKIKYSNQLKSHRYDKDMNLNANECAGVSNFGTDSSASDLSNKYNQSMTLSFNKNEDVSDMKLDFTFESEFSKLTDDNKSAAKSMELHAMQLGQSTDAELNRKIAQVKKVWDGSLAESYDDVMVNSSATSFSPSFSTHGSDPNSAACFVNTHVDGSEHLQVDDVGMTHNEVVFSPVSQMQGVNSAYGSVANCQTVVIKTDSTSSSSNVCKVKPQPQGTNMASNVAQSAVMSATLVSQPPPMSSPSYTFSCSTPQPSLNSNAVAATALAQMNFQAAAAQYNMPPVPSSPVLYNSTQPAAPGPTALYGAFQIDNQQVAARTQFNQFAASYGLSGQTSAFNQSVFMQQPPPSAPPPEIYPSGIPPYRLQPQAFGNTPQITSPNTVLISSSSNSLMSATIKPSNQPISAIGTKAGYPAAQTSQLTYIPLDSAAQLLNPNFMQGSQVLPRPASNLIPAQSLQAASTSFYTTGSGAGQTGYFPTGTNSALQPQPGTAIGLTPYNTQSAAPSLAPTMQNYSSQLTQQFRSGPSYLKNNTNACSLTSDFGNGKTITLSNQHDGLNSVFPPGTQMSSTKPRIPTGGKNVVQNVQQAMGQHSMSQNSYSYQSANQMRNNGGANKGSQYPHPIQRPVSQGNANSSNRAGNSAGNTSSHRMPVRNNAHQLVNNIQQQPPSSVYYTPSSGYSTSSSKLEASQLDSKPESNSDSKLADSIKTINSKNASVSSSEKTAVTNE